MRCGSALLLCAVSLAASCQAAGPPDRRLPNVVVVLADDLGLGDVSPTNPDCKIATPQLARLAREGLTFTDAHSPSAVCTPSRYGLLTGRYAWRTRLERGVLDGYGAPLIEPDRPTVARLLAERGYRTGMLGKWHLGWRWGRRDGEVDWGQPVEAGPDAAGFEHYFAIAASLDMPPYVWVEDGRVVTAPDREQGVSRDEDRYGWYREGPMAADFEMAEVLPTLFDRASRFVRDRADDSRPFFLYLALPAPHTPIVPTREFVGSSGLNPYGDFVRQIDQHLGELMGTLDQQGLAEETLFIFTSDNGPSPESNFELLRAAGHDPAAGRRGHKADLYEGGHRVPLIVRWPARIGGGRATDVLASLTDLYPTLEDLAGPRATGAGGEDGHSWLPLFDGAGSNGRESLISHSVSGKFAIRSGDWKLLVAAGSGGWSAPTDAVAERRGLGPVQLYDLARDPAEQRDLAVSEPERVAELVELLADQVRRGRSTPGEARTNDREIDFLPPGFSASSGSE
jgi:arylsulfatase A